DVDAATGIITPGGNPQPAATGYTGATGPGTFNPVGTPQVLRVEPTGKHAYALTPIMGAPSQMSVYSIDPKLGLTFLGLANLTTAGDSTQSLDVDWSGTHIVAADFGNTRQIHPYTVDASTGLLTAVTPVPTGDPNG